MKVCDICGREYQTRKNNINETSCGKCKAKLKKKQLAKENLKNKKYVRICSQCNSEIIYATKILYKTAIENKSLCKKCATLNHNKKMGEEQRLGLRENGFKGKSHSEETKEIFRNVDRSYLSELSYDWILKGKNHPNYGKSLYKQLVNKYGQREADLRYKETKRKLSLATSGKNNPMYGKPSPQGSGNGWSGWYKDFYFRSLHELQFLITCERFKFHLKSAENKEYKIKYIDFDGTNRNYFADYIVNNKWLVEVKPKRLWNTPKNKLKFEASREWCKQKGLIFKIIDFGKIESSIFAALIETNVIELNKRYMEKYLKIKNKTL